MTVVLRILELLVVLVAAWAVWVRRDSFHSRWDSAITVAIVLFGVGAMLDSPWPAVGAASFGVTGKFYVLTAVGHILYLAGATLGLKTVCLRLMPDEAIGALMRSRIRPAVIAAAITMLVSVLASPATAVMSAESLYQVKPDGWLLTYWAAYFLTMTGLNAVAVYGAMVLRRDADAVMVTPLAVATILGTLSCLGFLAAIVAGKTDLVHNLLWPAAYVAMIAGSVACALSWRHRLRALTTPATGD